MGQLIDVKQVIEACTKNRCCILGAVAMGRGMINNKNPGRNEAASLTGKEASTCQIIIDTWDGGQRERAVNMAIVTTMSKDILNFMEKFGKEATSTS